MVAAALATATRSHTQKEKNTMIQTPTNILIVDDEQDFVEMLAASLQEIKENVAWAYSGQECLEVLEKNNTDVVILDIKMPGMDGIETLKEIKKRFPLVEVIMLTGHGSIETAVEGMKLGAFDYLLKPAEFDELVKKVEGAKKRKMEHAERIRQAEAHALLIESRRGPKNPLKV
jgi:DNA-binding NtrC family response regulator